MEKFISVEKLIKAAIKAGVDFGKGDPYNRIRYYTKMGWIPHALRKKDKKGNVVGHYPNKTIDRLLLIEDLKEKGFSNDEITKKLATKNVLQNILTLISEKETRTTVLGYSAFVMLLLIFLVEMNFISIGRSKNINLNNSLNQNTVQLLDSGTGFIPSQQQMVFVKSDVVNNNTKINVTFGQSYTPATRYWIESVKDYEGFVLRLDIPVSDNAEFNWWVSN